MESIIIAMSGRKGAGKNTIARFITEWYQKYRNGDAIECSFADNLKDFCIHTLGLQYSQCYGSDEEKNAATEYGWDNASRFLQWKFADPRAKKLVASGIHQDELMRVYHDLLLGHPESMEYMTGMMTGREIMQILGTDLMRQTFGNIWAAATVRRIKSFHEKSLSLLAVITDNRFPNEIHTILQQPRGFIIRLTRSPYGTKDVHPSESALDSFDWNRERCYVLDNKHMTLQEQNEAILPLVKEIISS